MNKNKLNSSTYETSEKSEKPKQPTLTQLYGKRSLHYKNQIPDWLKDEWQKQAKKPQANLVINAGANEGIGQDVGKTSYDEWMADQGSHTVIFYKSGDSIEELLDRNYPFEIAVFRGLVWNIKNRYNLPGYKQKELLELLNRGYKPDTVKNFLPDNGEKFDDQLPIEYDGDDKPYLTKPVATVHQMIRHRELREAMSYGVWEENPHKPFEANLTMGRSQLQDCRKKFELPPKIAERFRQEMNNLWTQIASAERRVRENRNDVNCKQIRYQIETDKGNYRDFLHKIETIGWRYSSNVFEQVLNWLEKFGKLTGKIVQKIKDENWEEAKKLRRFKSNLRALSNFHGSQKICLNWEIKQNDLERGQSPYNRKDRTIATTWTQALETLYECNADICVNYAEATEELIRRIAPEYRWFTVEAEKSKAHLKAFKHEENGGSFSKTKMKKSPIRIQRAKNILKAMGRQGSSVGVVTYKQFTGCFSDFPVVYFGNHKGSNKLEDCDIIATVGTPNLPPYGLEFQHMLFFGEFSGFSKYGEQYEHSKKDKLYFPEKDENGNKLLETDFSLEGFNDRKLDTVFHHCVLKELRDATQRLRNQREDQGRHKQLLVFGFCPDLIWDNYKEDRRRRTDTVSFMSEKLGEIAEAEGEVPETIQELPNLPMKNLPDNLWRDDKKIVKKKDKHYKQEEVRDYLRRKGERQGDADSGRLQCDWKDVRNEVSGRNKEIKEAIEDSNIKFRRWGRKKIVYTEW